MEHSKLSHFFILVFTIILLSGVTLALPGYAAEYKSQLIVRDIGSPISLKELNLSNQKPLAEIKNAEEKLLLLSVDLRDIARTLGASWSVVVPLNITIARDNHSNPTNQKIFKITDIRDANGDWRSITVGHAIKLISQEVYTLKSDGIQPTADFLVRDNSGGKYHPLLGFTLDLYCINLLNKFNSI